MIRIQDLSVGEVMTPAPYCLQEDATLACAVRVLGDLKLSGAPVLNERGAVVGVISTSDLLGPVEHLFAGRLAATELRQLTVGDLASRPAVTIRVDEPLVEGCRQMGRTGFHRLVVVDEGGVPVGMLTSWDAAAAVGRLEKMQLEASAPPRSW